MSKTKVFGAMVALALVAGAMTACSAPEESGDKAEEPAKESQKEADASGTETSKTSEAPTPIFEQIGQPVSFSMVDTEGQAITSESLKGKAVLIDFWASWCGPCKEASKTMQELHEEFADQGLVVIGANALEGAAGGDSATASKDAAVAYAKEHAYSYEFTVNNDELFYDWGFTGVPAFVLIDKQGNVAQVFNGYGPTSADEFREAIKKQLG